MKIFSVSQIREADAYTIKHEPISSVDLMERAARACYQWFHENISRKLTIAIFCGKGNNGGDGLALARMLALAGFQVQVYLLEHSTNSTADFDENLKRLETLSIEVKAVKISKDLSTLNHDIIVDAILGSGLNKPLKGFLSETVSALNKQAAVKVAIDIPTGLFADSNQTNNIGSVFKADFTLTFQYPKLSFMFPEFGALAGQFCVLDIGLSDRYSEKTNSDYYFITPKWAKSLIPSRSKFDHKGTFGHALIIAGSKGKVGASILATRAALKTGTGLVTAYLPNCGLNAMQSANPEIMVSLDSGEDIIQDIRFDIKPSAIGMGPGLGTSEKTSEALILFLRDCKSPLVLDADALNILSNENKWELLPKQSVLTPHLGELDRMLGRKYRGEDVLIPAKEFAKKHNVFLVVKGANTAIYSPHGKVYFNSTGTNGMATAGSGDVLTGIITGLLAQNLAPLDAAILGVFIHGLAGEQATAKKGNEALVASDIIAAINLS